MIKQDGRMKPEVVGGIITNMFDLDKNNSSNDDDLIPGLQERAREDSFSDDNTNSYGCNVIYEDEKPWGYKALILKHIIGGQLCMLSAVWICQNM